MRWLAFMICSDLRDELAALRSGNTKVVLENQRLLEIWSIVDQLRAPEGACLSLFCDNPDFNMGANNAIEVTDDWTQWEPQRFEGDTLLKALRAALKAREEKSHGRD